MNKNKTQVSSADKSEKIGLISKNKFLFEIGLTIFGGLLFSAALPPLNLALLATLPVAILIYVVWDKRPLLGAFYGFIWGISWGLPSFFWLREIELVVPFLMAPALAAWTTVFGLSIPWIVRNFLYPASVQIKGEKEYQKYSPRLWRLILFTIAVSAWFVFLEFTRSTMLPWNNISTTIWKYPLLLSLARICGPYFIGFSLLIINVFIATTQRLRHIDSKIKKQYTITTIGYVCFFLLFSSVLYFSGENTSNKNDYRIGVVQGDISQRRNADTLSAVEALDIYLELTEELLKRENNLDCIVWPETAVPYAFKGSNPVSAKFRNELDRIVRQYQTPILFGTIDFVLKPDKNQEVYGITNSALLLGKRGYEIGRYDKIHRVPFGEYVPFRKILPEFVVKMIDMNRDLTPGKNFAPIIIEPNLRAGIAVCFESVFSYIAREEVRRGANMLIVISNDAWYPTSCEPEQHLANAIMRSVETGLYSLRVGNNGGTLLIDPKGNIVDILETPGAGDPVVRRGRASGVITMSIPETVPQTLYVRYGEWFITLCGLLSVVILGYSLVTYLSKNKMIIKQIEEKQNDES